MLLVLQMGCLFAIVQKPATQLAMITSIVLATAMFLVISSGQSGHLGNPSIPSQMAVIVLMKLTPRAMGSFKQLGGMKKLIVSAANVIVVTTKQASSGLSLAEK